MKMSTSSSSSSLPQSSPSSTAPPKMAPPNTGSNPPIYRLRSHVPFCSRTPPSTSTTRTIPLPWWFLPPSAHRFQTLPLHPDDVVISSGIKMGTTWMNRILSLLLHEVDDDGSFLPAPGDDPDRGHDALPNRRGQTYPEACYATRALRSRDPFDIFSRVPDGRKAHAGVFGDFVLEELESQPRPRMFATHLFGRRFLPLRLFDGWEVENEEEESEEEESAWSCERVEWERRTVKEKECPTNTPTETRDHHHSHSHSNRGTGKLVLVLRNAKDTLSSLHHFRGLPQDGWRGNDRGPGSFRRFLLRDECPNAMGCAFSWIRESDEAVEALLDDHDDGSSSSSSSPPRALVVYYEALVQNLPSQLHRLNSFLGLPPLTPAKLAAVQSACSLSSMSESSTGRFRQTARKGGIGDWKRHFDDDESREFDAVFNRVLNGVGCAEPLRYFQWREVGGMPWKRSGEHDVDGGNADDDPRRWEGYVVVQLREGMIVPHPFFSGVDALKRVERRLVPTTFRCADRDFPTWSDVRRDGPKDPPRYHLFVAESDPSALAVVMARTLLGLNEILSMDVADGQSGAGWVFRNGAGCQPWKEERQRETNEDTVKDDDEPFWLHQVYQRGDPLCTAEISVPLLWDTVEERIVSNDSWEILRWLSELAATAAPGAVRLSNTVVDVIGRTGGGGDDDNDENHPTLFPKTLEDELHRRHTELIRPLIDAIDTAGIEYFQHGRRVTAEVSEARTAIFANLATLDELLNERRFVAGDKLTAADILLASCLFQFDAAYSDAYFLRNGEGGRESILLGDSHPALKAYLRDMYGFLKPSVRFGSYRHHFRLHKAIETTRRVYSCEVLEEEIGRIPSIYDELPDLDAIVESIEKSAGEGPRGTPTASSSTQQITKIEGVPVPFWFRNDTFQLFRDLDIRDDDIVLSSGVKMGTTWVTKILNSLLHDFDDDGNTTPTYMDDSFPNRLGQTYPDALFPSRDVLRREMDEWMAKTPKGREPISSNFGDFVFDDLIHQPTPRLFSSHLFGKKLLPKRLFDGWVEQPDGTIATGPPSRGQRGKGRLIVVLRNLKDTLTSLHFFRGEPKDGWDGNEHGPGSFRRFIDLDHCPNAYGDSFHWIRSSAEAVEAVGSDRVLVVYYEALKANFPAQLRRINDFLGLPPLTEAKSRAIAEACSASKMRSETGGRFKYAIRKGSVGDWVNYLDDERWKELDRVFNDSLGGIDLAEPLRFFQHRDIPGMPLVPWRDCDLETDRRTWSPYLCVSLREGMIVPDPDIVRTNNAIKSNLSSTFRLSSYSSKTPVDMDEIGSDGSPRYHLFLSPSDPLASPIIAAIKLLGLENKVSVDISDGQSGAGWAFLNGASCAPWKGREGPFWLYEAYQLADPLCTTKISVPVLWDTVSERIVSNDSWEILKLLSTSSGSVSEIDNRSLFPEELRPMIEAMFSDFIGPLIDDVVAAGLEYFRNEQNETERLQKARIDACTKLRHLDSLLGTTRYLLGNTVTAVDLYFSALLFQFDACYLDAFAFRGSDGFGEPILSGSCYPNLTAYARDMFQLLKPFVHFESFGEVLRVGPSIALTRQSCSSGRKGMNTLHESDTATVPNLREIIAFLEQHAGVRPAN